MSEVTLSQAVEGLRQQLNELMQKKPGEGPRFTVNKADIELSLAISQEDSAQGGVKFSVLGAGINVGGGVKEVQQATHKVTLSLTPEQALTVSNDKDIDFTDDTLAPLK